MRYAVMIATLMVLPVPAFACLPPPPGSVIQSPPTVEERAERIFNYSDNIVYGILTRDVLGHKAGVLRIIHVYKGELEAGTHIPIESSWGFDAPMCSGMMPPFPTLKGRYGVLAWSGDAKLNWVSVEILDAMFEQKFIQSASGS